MSVEIRKPAPSESYDCARLLYISGPDLFPYLLAVQQPQIFEALKSFCQRPRLFSAENTLVEVENNHVRGLINLYPAGDEDKLGKQTFGDLRSVARILGIRRLLKMPFRMMVLKYFPKFKRDELIISSLAVYDSYRGMGVGTRLVEKADLIAKQNGLSKLALFVECGNAAAIRLYEKSGFCITEKIVLPEKYNNHHIYNYYKMIKDVSLI